MSSDSPLWDVRGWKRLTVHEDPPLVAARQEFLAWLAEVPEPHRTDLDARLHSDLDHTHLPACLELFVHHYFRSNGWEVQIHPQVPHTTNRPDFLVKREDDTLLVECRSIFDQRVFEQQKQRLRQLAEETGRKLGRTVILHPLCNLPPSIPARRIRSWIEKQSIPNDGSDLLEFDFWSDHQGYHYGVRAIVMKLNGGEDALAGIQGLMSQAQTVTNTQRLRMGLQEKASKYGTLDVPYVIAVSGETLFPMTTKDEVDALFGDRVWNIPQRGTVTVTETRNSDGLFTEELSNCLKYCRVSGVLVYRFKWLDQGHRHSMHIYHNPSAHRPIDPRLFPNIPQFALEGITMKWIDDEPGPY